MSMAHVDSGRRPSTHFTRTLPRCFIFCLRLVCCQGIHIRVPHSFDMTHHDAPRTGWTLPHLPSLGADGIGCAQASGQGKGNRRPEPLGRGISSYAQQARHGSPASRGAKTRCSCRATTTRFADDYATKAIDLNAVPIRSRKLSYSLKILRIAAPASPTIDSLRTRSAIIAHAAATRRANSSSLFALSRICCTSIRKSISTGFN